MEPPTSAGASESPRDVRKRPSIRGLLAFIVMAVFAAAVIASLLTKQSDSARGGSAMPPGMSMRQTSKTGTPPAQAVPGMAMPAEPPTP